MRVPHRACLDLRPGGLTVRHQRGRCQRSNLLRTKPSASWPPVTHRWWPVRGDSAANDPIATTLQDFNSSIAGEMTIRGADQRTSKGRSHEVAAFPQIAEAGAGCDATHRFRGRGPSQRGARGWRGFNSGQPSCSGLVRFASAASRLLRGSGAAISWPDRAAVGQSAFEPMQYNHSCRASPAPCATRI